MTSSFKYSRKLKLEDHSASSGGQFQSKASLNYSNRQGSFPLIPDFSSTSKDMSIGAGLGLLLRIFKNRSLQFKADFTRLVREKLSWTSIKRVRVFKSPEVTIRIREWIIRFFSRRITKSFYRWKMYTSWVRKQGKYIYLGYLMNLLSSRKRLAFRSLKHFAMLKHHEKQSYAMRCLFGTRYLIRVDPVNYYFKKWVLNGKYRQLNARIKVIKSLQNFKQFQRKTLSNLASKYHKIATYQLLRFFDVWKGQSMFLRSMHMTSNLSVTDPDIHPEISKEDIRSALIDSYIEILDSLLK